jgi:Ca2+/H+ antiporter, TMEM165/GDT1 family
MLGRLAMARVYLARRVALRARPKAGMALPGPGRAMPPSASQMPGPGAHMTLPELPAWLPLPAALVPALVSTGVVALAEIGDKTQLLALLLAARYRRPWAIAAGILLATLLNHALAGWLGATAAQWLPDRAMRWLVAGSFLAVALWALRPDAIDPGAGREGRPHHDWWAAFAATTGAFFLAEIGDKTQVATVLLAAQLEPLWQIVAGTTAGMLLANVPVVALGTRFAGRLPLAIARRATAALFALLAAWVAWGGG